MTRTRAVLPTLLAASAVGLALVVVPTGGQTAPVQAADSLRFWEGNVTKVSDGDTLWVDVFGDGTKKPVEVRNAGIQATEIAHATAGIKTDECHSREAMARMTELVFTEHKHVRLSAYNASSSASGRALRYVDVDTTPGPESNWVDVQQVLLEEGYVWWKPEKVEIAHNASYHVSAETAMRNGSVLYNPNYHLGACKQGPRQDTPIRLTLNYNGYLPNKGNTINGEWIRVYNDSDTDLSVAGWTITPAKHDDTFVFPKGTKVPAQGFVTLRAGSGKATSKTFYWKQSTNPFTDPVYGLAWPGRGAYLLDPDGDVRAYMAYPCTGTCSDPLRGRVKISNVQYNAPGVDQTNPNGEYVEIKSTSGTVDLSGYVIERYPYNKVFPTGTILKSGETLRVKMGRGTNQLSGTTPVVYLGSDHGILTDSGQQIVLRSAENVRLDCDAWGSYSNRC